MQKQRRPQENNARVNLVPVMAIMVILIPMIMYMFEFHRVTVHRVLTPRMASACISGNCHEGKPLDLTVTVRRTGAFEVSWSDHLSPTPALRQIPPSETGHDYKTLEHTLETLRKGFEADKRDARKVNLAADESVHWDVISHTMDALRGRRAEARTTIVLGVVD